MEFVSKAYREGQRAGKYEDNPYSSNSNEFDEFERGVKQAQLLKSSEPVRHTGGYWGDPENDVTGSVPYRKASNSYLLAKKK
tara:strand:+ start:481 stop:726 length:246 start_codon:yes stop_codon:yes gene_type:complete